MSDQPPPPKPKPGSLRDRIAAFEKQPATSGPAPGGPPAPRPKPGGLQWKPKAPSPPSSPGAAEHVQEKKAGMSASDAKESIGKGGSLKERMAALQGRGAFGAPPPVAPKPPMEKPKWKSPPVISPPPNDEDDEEDAPKQPIIPTSPPVSDAPASAPEPSEDAIPDAQDKEADPEDEERQRRAAIAARMARLGGARVGMGAPIFGHKPTPKKVETPSAEAKPSTEEPPAVSAEAKTPEPEAKSEPGYFPPADAPTSVPQDSTPATSPPSQVTSPRMPIPAGPRRAAPPRKKAPKTPTPETTVDEPSKQTPALDAAPEEAPAKPEEPKAEVDDKEYEATAEAAASIPEDASGEAESPAASPPAPESKVIEPEDVPESEPTVEYEEPEPVRPDAVPPPADETQHATPDEVSEPHPESSKPREEETPTEEEEEEARKARVAEKMAKMGGVNPLAGIPRRQSSTTSAHEADTPQSPPLPPHPVRQASTASKRSSILSERAVPPSTIPQEDAPQSPPLPPHPARQASTASKRSSILSERAVPPPPVAPRSPELQQSRKSTDMSASIDSLTEEVHPHVDSPEQHFVEPKAGLERAVPPPTRSPEPLPRRSMDSVGTAFHEQVDDADEEPAYMRRDHDGELLERDEIDEDDVEPHSGAHHGDEQESESEYMTSSRDEEPASLQSTPPRSPPPLPRQNTRPVSHLRESVHPPRPASTDQEDSENLEDSIPALPVSSARRPVPPPRLALQSSESEAEEDEQQEPRMIHPRTMPASSPQEPTTPAPELLRRVPPPRPMQPIPDDVDPDDSNVDSEAEPTMLPPRPPISARQLSRPVPPPQPSASEEEDDQPDDDEAEAVPIPAHEERILHTLPRRSVPPPSPPVDSDPGTPAEPEEEAEFTQEESDGERQADVHSIRDTHVPPTLSLPDNQEVLDEDEGDPIDPSFHSPSPNRRSFIIDPVETSTSHSHFPAEEKVEEPHAEKEHHHEEDPEVTRRRGIAERMAKLGGIKFGAAPPMGRPVSKRRESSADDAAPAREPREPEGEEHDQARELTEEEEEIARKQRIASKLAGMGGMRIGMLPPGASSPAAMSRRQASGDSVATTKAPLSPPPPPPPASRPPARAPPPPAPEPDSEYESTATSDDGVKVEAEESELEEVSHQDAMEDIEEETPPPIPTRSGRGSVSSPPDTIHRSSTSGRPPVPAGMRPNVPQVPVPRKSSSGSNYTPMSPPSRRTSVQRPQPQHQQSDFVMVDENEDVELVSPPVPRKRASIPPGRGAPPPPPPAVSLDPSDSVSSQWELPSIPTSSLSYDEGTGDLSLSWSEDSTTYPSTLTQEPSSATSTGAPPPPAKKHALPENLQLSAEELMSIWGKVGVHVCEAATTLYENSKKMLIGDGTFEGFIYASLKEVPSALALSSPPHTYGYTIYAQTGSSVQKRASEILPGDIVVLHDAKFKGHKGLQSYSQHVGSGDVPLVGVINEFEPKKSKIRVLQANQHVGQQTVESTSYRLDDLKSGAIKVFRVLEV